MTKGCFKDMSVAHSKVLRRRSAARDEGFKDRGYERISRRRSAARRAAFAELPACLEASAAAATTLDDGNAAEPLW